ncbi:hypothetical protein GO755_36955 [Spirosoma sp. HMF4905]|uniref:Uncharacterized protein n=1 Tax=Spirosoma arboris TaxID=2682092 RepID=A0A7K1SPC2_9BACT|nr:hypothetical protein [Spirosoma arboris]MVM35664.1 hypothetical protein [Spirosoma arboris]
MNSISRRVYEELVQQLGQLRIRGNRHKVALFAPLTIDPSISIDHQLTVVDTEQSRFAFNLMFERNNPESEWRLVTPLKFTE